MKLALLSDVHANAQALEACIGHARQAGATHWAVLGDAVGYGAQPAQVVQRLMDLAAQGAWVLKGNHDEAAVTPPATVAHEGDRTALWTHQQLSAEQRHFLDTLPLTHVHDSVMLVHATADAPRRWRYADHPQVAAQSLDAAAAQPGVRHVFGGHVHEQTLYFRTPVGKLMPFAPTPGVPIPVSSHRLWLATVGSVGQPRDGNPKAMYALYDAQRQQLTFHRVAYDHLAAAAAVRAAGLPEAYALRLETGR